MSIEQEISDAIEKNLPSMLGTKLRERLEQADKDAAELGQFKKLHVTQGDQNQRLRDQVSALQEQLNQHKALDIRENEVAARERDAEIAGLKVQLNAEQRMSQYARDVAMGLVRNVEYRKSVFENGMTPISQNGCVMQQPHNSNSGETNSAT